MNDEKQQDPEAAMERFEDLTRKVFSKAKDDVRKAEDAPRKSLTRR